MSVPPTTRSAAPIPRHPNVRFNGDRAKLGLPHHLCRRRRQSADHSAALVTPSSIMDNTPIALDLERWVRFRWRLAAGDRRRRQQVRHGAQSGEPGAGWAARLHSHARSQPASPASIPSTASFMMPSATAFICPEEHSLHRVGFRPRSKSSSIEHADPSAQCLPSKAPVRTARPAAIPRFLVQDVIDRVQAYQATNAYKKARRKRKFGRAAVPPKGTVARHAAIPSATALAGQY